MSSTDAAPPSHLAAPSKENDMIERIRTKVLWAVIVLALLVIPLRACW